MEKISLFFCEGTSDKEYHTQLEASGSFQNYVVNFQYGRRGSSLTSGTKTPSPLPYDKAKKIYDKLVAEKVGKGYKVSGDSGTSFVTAGTSDVLIVPQLLDVITEEEVEKFLRDDSFGSQEKMNGVRKMVHKVTEETFMTNKKGKRVAYLSTYDISLKNFKSISLDGEEIGERLFAFDLLEYEGQSLRSLGYAARYDTLKNINFTSSSNITVIELAIGYKQKKAMYDRLKAEGKEGIVFKKLDASFTAGKGHGCMFKCKFYSTVSVRVCKGREGKRSIGMELFDGTQWIPVGNCTLPSDKTVVPSVGSISEIRYLYAYKGGSLYQPTYLGPRDDVDADECLINQLKYKPDEEVFNSCNNLTKSKEIC